MSVSVEKTSSLGRRLTIQVPAETVKQEEQNRLKDLAKNIRLEGFRKGKVPANFIQKKYGTQIHQEAVSTVLQKSLSEALKEQNMRLANRPNVEDLHDSEGQDLKYTVVFEVYPEVELKDFSQIELEKEIADITEKDVQSGIEKLQDQFATWQDVTDRAAQMGDKLVIDFVGYLDGEPFEHGSANDQAIELGSKTFIPGFEDGLVGAKIGEDTTVKVTFPEDYSAKNLAGKDVEFKVQVKGIQSKSPAIVNEDFAKRIGIEDSDAGKVASRVRENMVKYLDDLSKTRLRDQVIEKLYEAHPIDIPQSLLDDETHNLIHEKEGHGHAHDENANHDHDDISDEELQKLRTEARKRITVGLVLNEIISKHNIKPEEDRILAKLASMSMMYGGGNAEMIRKMFSESKEMQRNIENMVLTEQAADLVLAGATIKEKQSTFYDIVNAKANN